MTKKLIALVLALVMAAFAVACTTGNTNGNTTGGTPAAQDQTTDAPDSSRNSLNLYDSEWLGTDLYRCSSWTGLQDLISDSFFIQDPDDPSNILPNICTGYEVSDDGLTIKLLFPDDLKFYDGTSVTPDDVIASIQYGQEYSEWGYGYSNIESMEADGNDVILHLNGYRTDLMYFLSHSFMGILKADGINNLTEDQMQWGAIPYGQFYVDEYVAGSHITLKPNPYYKTNNPLVTNQGPSKLDHITIKIADTETFSLDTMLESGDLDMLSGINMTQYAELKDMSDVVILDSTFPNIEYCELNTDSPSLSDYNVRKAIFLALDRDAMEEVCQGSMKPEYSMITSGVQYYTSDAADWFKANLANNVEEAKQLLADAGYTMNSDGYLEKDGSVLEFSFLARSSGTSVTVAQEMQNQLKEIGIKMDIETIDWNYIYDRISDDDYDMGIECLEWGEPILVLNYCYYDSNGRTQDETDAYNAKVEQCATTADVAAMEQLITDIQMDIFQSCTMLPLYSDIEYCAYRSDIPGLVVTSNGGIFFNDVEF